ncbi:GLPGLI family protein [Aureibaculum conchae]|uniref:GLPGLI family protein n=1 Tax=Aureibaculum sp. 2308TA14-22 TaxID=3108392 RepID=UPI003392B266
MNPKLTFIFILLISVNMSYAQESILNHKFIYNLTYQSDSTNINSKQSEKMLLFTGNDGSIFQSYNGFVRDSMLLELKNNPEKQNSSLSNISSFPKTQFSFKIIKTFNHDSLIVFEKIFIDNFRYDESKENIKWEIKSDTMTINGFESQKATTFYAGRKYEAWFSSEIPISDGPYKFSGLPGLIIKISDVENHYVFELIEKVNISMTYPSLKTKDKLFITDKSTFFKKLKEFKNNIFERASQAGFTVDEEYKQQIKVKLNKKNNPIELNDNDQ